MLAFDVLNKQVAKYEGSMQTNSRNIEAKHLDAMECEMRSKIE